MNKYFALGVLALVSSVAVVLAAAAFAGPRTQVAFAAQMNGFTGTLTASSVPGCPAGATVSTPQASFFVRGAVGHFTGQHKYGCDGGDTFTLSYIANGVSSRAISTGTWKIVEGTGVFAGLAGNGTLSGAGNPGTFSGVELYTGTMTLP